MVELVDALDSKSSPFGGDGSIPSIGTKLIKNHNMKQIDFITQALNLTLFGMGFVFLFLTLLVGITKLMSMIIQKLQSKTHDKQDYHNSEFKDEMDEETKFIIEQAIKMHRGA